MLKLVTFIFRRCIIMSVTRISMETGRCFDNGNSSSSQPWVSVIRFTRRFVQHLVKEADLGKKLDKVVEDLRATYGG